MNVLLAAQSVAEESTHAVPLIHDPAGVLAVLLGCLALVFWASHDAVIGRVFKVVPPLVFCYFLPTALSTLGVIPHESALYAWVKAYVLPASLVLLVLAIDLPGILRLGWKAIVMLLAGTAGVVIGGPLSFLICQKWLPEDAWRGMAALSGSWIGGGANFVAIGQSAAASDEMIALMVVPDVLVANIWMGVLLLLASKQATVDRWTRADTSAIDDLRRRLTDFQERTSRPSTLPDLLTILAIAFAGAYGCYELGVWLEAKLAFYPALKPVTDVISADTWKYILVTAVGLVLSFTSLRNLEGAGASRIGSTMLYLLVACIGAHASFEKAWEYRSLVGMGFVWMSFHIIVLLGVGKLIRAPIFLVAVGSQANIGGAASAPIVASAFHPSLAPVGALLAVAGYVLGTYAGLACMRLLMMAAGVSEVVPTVTP